MSAKFAADSASHWAALAKTHDAAIETAYTQAYWSAKQAADAPANFTALAPTHRTA